MTLKAKFEGWFLGILGERLSFALMWLEDFVDGEFIKGEKMQNNKFLVLDIGSGKMRLGELEFEEDKLDLESYVECDYAGFVDGSFIEDDVEEACEKLVEDIDVEEISTVFVGVPSEFCGQCVKDLTSTFDAPLDLEGYTRSEFLRYAESDEMVAKIEEGVVINVDVLDLSAHKSGKDELGSANVSGRVSYIYADSQFLNMFSNIFEKLGFKNVEFTCAINAQIKHMLDEKSRKLGMVFVDVGYLTTSVAVVNGDGIESLRSFSLGGGHISADLSEGLNIPYKVADCLKKKVLLTVDPSEVDYYVVNVDGNDFEFKASDVNKIVKAKIDHIATMVSKCIEQEQYAYGFVVTGGGLNDIKGALDIFSASLGVVAKNVPIEFADLSKPEYSALVSLIYEASSKVRARFSALPFWKKWWEKVKNIFDF